MHKLLMVDVAVPDDQIIGTTEAWEIERYYELAFKVRRIHQVEVVWL